MIHKKIPLYKFYLKLTDRKKYKEYKWELQNQKQKKQLNLFRAGKRVFSLNELKDILRGNDNQIGFCHSGNAGDIIYALATLKRLHELTNCKPNLYLVLNQSIVFSGYLSHPTGNVMLNENMYSWLYPLLASQPYLHVVDKYDDQLVHVDLDYFRTSIFPLNRGNIARWCGYTVGINPKLYEKWLIVEDVDISYRDKVLLARSGRYQNKSIDYSFLNNYDNIFFIGVESEFKAMKKTIHQLKWVRANDFLQLANIVAGCKFFIGNQSFPFSLAEALKVPRILEPSPDIINVVPEGPKAYDFLFQEHFESLVDRLQHDEII